MVGRAASPPRPRAFRAVGRRDRVLDDIWWREDVDQPIAQAAARLARGAHRAEASDLGHRIDDPVDVLAAFKLVKIEIIFNMRWKKIGTVRRQDEKEHDWGFQTGSEKRDKYRSGRG